MANFASAMHGHVTNPTNPGQNFPGYLTGFPIQTVSKTKGRRDKPYIKFHIGFLELANSKPKAQPKEALPDHQTKPYRPIQITDWINNPPGSGKAAKKARRRCRKRAARAQAKAEAAEQERLAKERGDADREELERQKAERGRQLYASIKRDMAERAERAERDKKKRETEEEKKRAEIRKGKRRASVVEADEAAVAAAALSGRNKRKRDAEDPDEDRSKKVKFAHDEGHESIFSDDDSDVDSLFGDKLVPEDPINTLPNLGSEAPELANMPQEILECIVDYCDPFTRTLLGLTSKRFGQLAITHGAGFPSVRDRYGGDLERHRFMSLLEPWMNREYSEAPEPITIAEQTEREKLKKLRLCYICRKYLPISVDPDSQAARRAEIERRRAAQSAASRRGAGASGSFASLMNHMGAASQGVTIGDGSDYVYGRYKPLPKDEDWTTLSVGLCKSSERMRDVKSICPKCTLTVHTVHLGWPPETPVVCWLEEGNPLGRRMSMGHEPQRGFVNDMEVDDELEFEDD